MRKIPRPTDRPEDVFRNCISLVRDPSLKKKLAALERDVIAAGADFLRRAGNNTLYQIPSKISFRGGVSAIQLKKIYTDRMAKKNTPGRPFYDKVLASARQGICPLCGQRVASTIDHYLAKASYPIFSVLPLNLVPACKDCNIVKNEYPDPTRAEEETLHPYFDDIENDPWLCADVVQGQSPSLRFIVQPVQGWSSIMEERVKYHFSVFALGKLYATHSAVELASIRYSLDALHAAGGSDSVRAHLEGEYQSRLHAHVNSWQTAMYKALAESDWFCSTGFSLI